MKIKEVTRLFRNDFSAIMICEHCGHEGELTTGYDDGFYHIYVIPSMICGGCGVNRDGTTDCRDGVNGATKI